MGDESVDLKRLDAAIDAWKKVVDVQQHFNTIEMQIRNLAVTVLTATIAAAAIVHNELQQRIADALKDGLPAPPATVVDVLCLHFSTADMIILGGLVAWGAFYFMDRWWYHPFLKAATDRATALEAIVAESAYGDILGLSGSISGNSPMRVFGKELRSNQKINLFYGTVAAVMAGTIAWVF